MPPTTAQALARDVTRLFTLPDVALRLNALIQSPNATTQELAQVVQLDPGLAATLLKIANSAYYGLASRVDTLSRAIAVIGERELQTMAMATAVVSTFKGLPEDLVDMASFWDNSVTCGVLARLLGRRCGVLRNEQMFLAGLLHGVGKLVFYARVPDAYREMLLQAGPVDDRTLAAAEARTFGFDYATLGAALLQAWNLPSILRQLVACQLRPGEAADYPREAAVLHVATDLAAFLSPQIKDKTLEPTYTPGFDPGVAVDLSLSEDALLDTMAEANVQTLEILDVLSEWMPARS